MEKFMFVSRITHKSTVKRQLTRRAFENSFNNFIVTY